MPVNDAPLPEGGDTVWSKQPPVNPRKLFPKKKARWGLIEVTNSLIILVVLQIAFAIYLMFDTVAENLSMGIEDPQVITEAILEKASTPTSIIISSILMYFSWLFMMWYATRFRGYRSFAKDFWVRIKPKDILWGLLAGAVLFGAVQGASYVLTLLGADLTGSDNTQVFQGHGALWGAVLLIGLVGIIGPLMEELFFRGFLLQGLIRHFRRGNISGPRGTFSHAIQSWNAPLFNGYLHFRNWCYKHKYTLSVIISSLIFGMMHFGGVVDGNIFGPILTVLITGSLGAVFAIIALRTRRLGINIFAHMTYNSIIAVMILLG
ncbi:MAG: CPBP family intramembrane metalloprotease [Enterococcus sp.]|nr:CPBP family intramembrane metalloprotease [Enterococcus sp.]